MNDSLSNINILVLSRLRIMRNKPALLHLHLVTYIFADCGYFLSALWHCLYKVHHICIKLEKHSTYSEPPRRLQSELRSRPRLCFDWLTVWGWVGSDWIKCIVRLPNNKIPSSSLVYRSFMGMQCTSTCKFQYCRHNSAIAETVVDNR